MEAKSAANSDRLYEDFEPVCKWIREEGHDVVEVPLPGFKREQIKIKIDHLGFMVISGEQPLPSGEPKWRRFIKEIRVPDYCHTYAVRAKYAGHILSVIMPKTFPEEGQELMERSVAEFDPQKKLQEDFRVKEVKDVRKKVRFKGICGMQVSNCRKPVGLVVVFAILVALVGYVISKYKNFTTEL